MEKDFNQVQLSTYKVCVYSDTSLKVLHGRIALPHDWCFVFVPVRSG